MTVCLRVCEVPTSCLCVFESVSLCGTHCVSVSLCGSRWRLNDCSMKHYIVLNMALFSHAHVTISAEIKLTHACSRGDVSHERTAAA